MAKNIPIYRFDEDDDLSTRALNIIKELEGEEAAFQYFKVHDNFLGFRNIGIKTNAELVAYFQLKKEKQAEDAFKKPINNINYVFDYYTEQKQFLKSKEQDVLTKIEEKFICENGLQNKESFLKYLFNQKVSLKGFKLLSTEAEDLLNRFVDSVSSYAFEGNSDNSIKLKVLHEKVIKFTKVKDDALIEVLIDNELYNLILVVALRVQHQIDLDKQKIIFNKYFLSSTPYNLSEIAEIANCTKELVRVYVKKWSLKFIPSVVKAALNRLKLFSDRYYACINKEENFLIINDEVRFMLNRVEYQANNYFIQIVAKTFFKDTHQLFYSLIKNKIEKSKSFVYSSDVVLISKKAIVKFDIIKLLLYLEDEIYDFETVNFKYDFDVLVKRFFTENNISIERADLLKLSKIIIGFKRSDFKLRTRVIKNEEKNTLIEYINCEILKLFYKNNTALSSKEVVDWLKSQGIEVDRHLILNVLNSEKSLKKIGNSTWVLKSQTSSSGSEGSLREIAEHYISSNSNPVHVSELLDLIRVDRNISEHSFVTNLRISGKFKFFNCGFIGLKSQQYHPYYSSLPNQHGFHFKKETLAKLQIKYNGNIIAGLKSEYGYPEVHSKYILDNRR